MSLSRFARKVLIASVLTFSALPALAQDSIPELPPPLKTLQDQGAQIRFLGKDYGVDGWIAIKQGQEQYFYVLPGGQAFLSGVLIDNKGKLITIEQVAALRSQGDDVLDKLASGQEAEETAIADATKGDKYEFKTPSEKLYYDLENSNWIPIGKAGTPMLYAFVDPNCKFCHAMMDDLKAKYIDKDLAQVRIVPVGFSDQSKAQAAFLLAAPDPASLWWKHLAGDKEALPAKAEISQQGVERNMSVMQSWKFDVTPMVVYRAKDNSVKIVKGRPKDLDGLIKDLGTRS